MLTDEQLVDASLEGSDKAFGELVERYRERLLRFLVTRSVSQEDAEDATQDTFISAYRYLYSFDKRWRFSTWLYRIALRNVSRQVKKTILSGQDAATLADESADPLQTCLADSDKDNVWLTARSKLSTEAFAAMWLRYVEDMSVKEVSRALEKSVSWTKVTLMRSRRTLEAELSEVTPARSESYG